MALIVSAGFRELADQAVPIIISLQPYSPAVHTYLRSRKKKISTTVDPASTAFYSALYDVMGISPLVRSHENPGNAYTPEAVAEIKRLKAEQATHLADLAAAGRLKEDAERKRTEAVDELQRANATLAVERERASERDRQLDLDAAARIAERREADDQRKAMLKESERLQQELASLKAAKVGQQTSSSAPAVPRAPATPASTPSQTGQSALASGGLSAASQHQQTRQSPSPLFYGPPKPPQSSLMGGSNNQFASASASTSTLGLPRQSTSTPTFGGAAQQQKSDFGAANAEFGGGSSLFAGDNADGASICC